MKPTPWLIAFAAMSLAAGMAHAVQTVSIANLTRGGAPVTSPLFVAAGDVVKFDASLTANGSANPPGSFGLGLCLEYKVGAIGHPNIGNLSMTDLLANGDPDTLAGCTAGGSVNVPGADSMVQKGYAHIGSGGGWPNAALPFKIYDAQFTLATTPSGLTLIGFGASAVPSGETFVPGPTLVLCGKPTVSIIKTADGSEAGSTPAKFSVTLSAAIPTLCGTGGPFPVTLALGGTATVPGQSGADYAISGTNVVNAGATVTINFPVDGTSTTTSVVVTPVDDSLIEGTETVTLTVATGSGNYLTGGANSASVNISDNEVLTMTPSPAAVPGGAVGVAFATQNFAAAGGTAPYTFALASGALPPGLTLTSAGLLGGTPIAAGNAVFTVRVSDSTSPGVGGPLIGSLIYNVTIGKGSQSVAFTSTAPVAPASGTSYIPSATATSGLVVALSIDPSTINACSISAGTVTFVTGGNCIINANQAGSANYNAAAQVSQSIAVVIKTSYTGPSPAGVGSITASFNGGGAGCGYSKSQYIPISGNGASPPAATLPAGVTFPQGLFDFRASGCIASGTLSFTITYPAPFPFGTYFWKYGPTAATPAPHWYVFPATILGNTITFMIADGGFADDDLAANGVVAGLGGPAVATGGIGFNLDADGNASYDALTDGLLVIRYLFGLTGGALTNGAIGTGATRIDATAVLTQLDYLKPLLDVDGNGQADALTDGLMLMRYLFGLRGGALVAGAIGPGALRNAAQIEAYIQSLVP